MHSSLKTSHFLWLVQILLEPGGSHDLSATNASKLEGLLTLYSNDFFRRVRLSWDTFAKKEIYIYIYIYLVYVYVCMKPDIDQLNEYTR